ncbi:hypothetical protein CARN8_7240004 [mine drainage metagenome]|jgi:hypothetical protein|uniref:Uncharacterized protein n=1 Tax=mine drainage metagenome TaxID=410659 RepID=A0A3P3ZS61_9ZZZZ
MPGELEVSIIRKNNMKAGDLVSEIQKMTLPRPAAIIFGLEMRWPLSRVVFLTWDQGEGIPINLDASRA